VASTIASNATIGSATSAARSAWATASALYVVVADIATSKHRVYKSTDGTTWTEQDAADAPAFNISTSSTWLAGGYLYLVYFTAINTLRVRRFNTSTDSWETADIGAADITTAASNAHSVRVVVRSDGDVIVFYRNSTDSDVYYARYEGVSWTAVAVHTTNTSAPQDATIDSSDRTYFFFHEETANDASVRTLDSANTLGTQGDLDAAAHATFMRASNACLYNDGTNNKVGILTRDTGGELDFQHATQADNPSWTAVNAVSTSTAPQTHSCAVETFNSKVYAVWSEGNTIKYDASDDLATPAFGADVTLFTSAIAATIPQWLTGLSGFGAVFVDLVGGVNTVKVEWITAPPPPVITLDADVGTLTLSGIAATPALALAGDVGARTHAGLAADPVFALIADAGALTRSGADAALAVAVAADAAALAYQGHDAETPWVHEADAGALALAGLAADPWLAIDAGAGTLAFVGLDGTPVLVADAGVAALFFQGHDADPGPFGLFLDADVGALAFVGVAADLLLIFAADAGSVAFAGEDATPVLGIDAGTGGVAYAGLDADAIAAGPPLDADVGGLAFGGEAATPVLAAGADAGTATYGGEPGGGALIAGADAGTLTYGGETAAPVLAAHATVGAALWSGLAPAGALVLGADPGTATYTGLPAEEEATILPPGVLTGGLGALPLVTGTVAVGPAVTGTAVVADRLTAAALVVETITGTLIVEAIIEGVVEVEDMAGPLYAGTTKTLRLSDLLFKPADPDSPDLPVTALGPGESILISIVDRATGAVVVAAQPAINGGAGDDWYVSVTLPVAGRYRAKAVVVKQGATEYFSKPITVKAAP
jgi:hypothetical protein